MRPAALLLLFAAVFVLARAGGVSDRLSPAGIRDAIRGLGFWAPAGLVAAFLLRPLLLIPITPFWVVSGVLLGWVEGALWATAGTSLGAGVGFWLARGLGRGFVERKLGPRVARWAAFAKEDGFRTVLALQLTPVVPHDLINNLAGVSRMTYRSFFLGSLLGTIPIITIYAYAGAAVWEIPSAPFWIALALLSALTITMLMWNRRRVGRPSQRP